jgi:hypothetical protein
MVQSLLSIAKVASCPPRRHVRVDLSVCHKDRCHSARAGAAAPRSWTSLAAGFSVSGDSQISAANIPRGANIGSR